MIFTEEGPSHVPTKPKRVKAAVGREREAIARETESLRVRAANKKVSR